MLEPLPIFVRTSLGRNLSVIFFFASAFVVFDSHV